MDKEKLNKRVLLALADVIILNAIKKEPMCRQEISTWFLRNFDTPVNGSTLHPVVMRLKDNKLVKIKKDGAKRVFHLTPEGENLRRNLAQNYSNIHKEVLDFIK